MRIGGVVRLAAPGLLVLLGACSGAEQDFCRYLSLGEAQEFDPDITTSEMRQTKVVLYCVWKAGASDRLFISLDRPIGSHPRDFLKVLAKNSPEAHEDVITLSDVGGDGAALFLGDGPELKLDFLMAQNSHYSVTMRAPNVERHDTRKLDELRRIARTVLARIR